MDGRVDDDCDGGGCHEDASSGDIDDYASLHYGGIRSARSGRGTVRSAERFLRGPNCSLGRPRVPFEALPQRPNTIQSFEGRRPRL